MEYVTVYDQSGLMLGVLENADEVAYTLTHNDLWTASFALPSGDPKNTLCQAHNLVCLPDETRDTGLYRIVGMPSSQETAQGGEKTYSLEHVMATLLDDVLFGYHEIGGTGVTTSQVIAYILARQTVQRWTLGVCEFSDQFVYKFENATLLSALLSLGNVLTEDYTWDFDTSAVPWTVNLRHADASPGCGIHYMRNMVEIEKTMDASALITRLYMLGYGEGVNQLTIREANGGLPYIDADTAAVWGVKSSVFADTRIEDAETLKARGLAVLERYKNPYISYTASAIDLTRITGQEWDNFMPGKLVHVMDGEHGVDFSARIVAVSKSDVRGRPGDIEITIANTPRDAADSINTLADRMGISELYSQGATNLYAQQFADNADESHPAKMRVFVPSSCVRINQMLLSWTLEPFRAYETGAEAGGATVTTTQSDGASTQTSSAGGASERTSNSGGAQTVTKEQTFMSTTAATGGVISEAGYPSGCTGGALGTDGVSVGSETSAAGGGQSGSTQVVVEYADAHTHSFSGSDSLSWGHSHSTYSSFEPGDNTGGVNNYSAKTISISGTTGSGGRHYHTTYAHSHSVSAHTHTMPHVHRYGHYHNVVVAYTIPAISIDIPAHSHVFETENHTHSVSIPAHQHGLTLGNHTHEILHGIYEGATATDVTLKVDGSAIPASAVTSDEMDIVAFLAKDEDGKITRGTWHEIEIVPDGLTRIEASLFVQTFIQSVGGGDY